MAVITNALHIGCQTASGAESIIQASIARRVVMVKNFFRIEKIFVFRRTNRIDEIVIAHNETEMLATNISCRIMADLTRVVIKYFLADFVGSGPAADIAFLAGTAC